MSRVITAPGLPAAVWTAALAPHEAYEPSELLELGPGDRLVVAVPHPDDETLALGGTLQRLHGAGVHVVLVLVTAGVAAYCQTWEHAAVLGRIRIKEFHQAVGVLGLDPLEVHQLDLPDGMLDRHEAAVLDALTDTLTVDPLRAGGRRAVLAPWILDPHPDHQAVGRAAGIAARRVGSMCWSYPVWMRHGLHPGDPSIPWPDLRRVALSPTERERKRAAIETYVSQLDDPARDVGPVLPPYVVEHFTDGHEVLIRPAPSGDEVGTHFEALYEGNADPWQVGTSRYERRKRAVLLASLPRERYSCIWEPGCSLGHLSAELALRCDRLVSSDISARAVLRARELIAAQHVTIQHVTIEVAQTPAQAPVLGPRSCDLVVLSGFLYYLPDRDRAATIELAATLLAPGGHLVVAHWRGHPADAHCSGEQANAEVVAALGGSLVHHVDEHFVLDVAVLDVALLDIATQIQDRT
ncbi:hypothetical protein BH24ACT9_BH24ACT9_03680 [soil metagenome]